MQMYESLVKVGGQVSFPEFTGEKVYMLEFYQKNGLPEHLNRWQSTVDQMLAGVQTSLPIYLMIDQAFVAQDKYQRRSGLHIDGYWVPEQQAHGGNSGGSHGDKPKHSPKPDTGGRHGDSKHGSSASSSNTPWETASFDYAEAIILASNVSAARGFAGQFSGPVRDMGSCEHISTDGLQEVRLEANKAYIGNVTFLHETLPVESDCNRTIVRLNVPGLAI